MLVISRRETQSLLDLGQLVMALARAMADLSSGQAAMPARTLTPVATTGHLGSMSAYLPSTRTLATKLVSILPDNADRGRPTHQAVTVLFDATTGETLAVMDATFLTAARTAAGSVLATRLLARENAPVLAVLGTGVQAAAHVRTLALAGSFEEIRVAGRDPDKAARLADEASVDLGTDVVAATGFAEALREADVVCACTHSPDPVVRREWLSPGTHVNSVGLHPEGREVDADTVAGALVVVESREAALAGPGAGGANDLLRPIRDGIIDTDHIHAEIGELVTRSRPGRTSDEQITLYKSVGVAVQDAAAAALVYAGAIRHRQGVEVDLTSGGRP